jgi:hypothetical protein
MTLYFIYLGRRLPPLHRMTSLANSWACRQTGSIPGRDCPRPFMLTEHVSLHSFLKPSQWQNPETTSPSLEPLLITASMAEIYCGKPPSLIGIAAKPTRISMHSSRRRRQLSRYPILAWGLLLDVEE